MAIHSENEEFQSNFVKNKRSEKSCNVSDKRDEDDLDSALDQAYEKQNQAAEGTVQHVVREIGTKKYQSIEDKIKQQEDRKQKFRRIGSSPKQASVSQPSKASPAPTAIDSSEQVKVKYVRGADGKLKKKVKRKKAASQDAVGAEKTADSPNRQSDVSHSHTESVSNKVGVPPPAKDNTSTLSQTVDIKVSSALPENQFSGESGFSSKNVDGKSASTCQTQSSPSPHPKGILKRASNGSMKAKSVSFANSELTEKEILDEQRAQERLAAQQELEKNLELERERVKKELIEGKSTASNQDLDDDGSDIFSDEGSDYNPFEDTLEKKDKLAGLSKQKVADYFSNNIGTQYSAAKEDLPAKDSHASAIKDALEAAHKSPKRPKDAEEEEENDQPQSYEMRLTPFSGNEYDDEMYMVDDDDADSDDDQQRKKRKR